MYENFSELNVFQGLSEQQVKANLEKYGENVFEPPDHAPGWLILLQHMFGGFSSLLLLGAGLCFWSSWIQHYFLEDLTFEYVSLENSIQSYLDLKEDIYGKPYFTVLCWRRAHIRRRGIWALYVLPRAKTRCDHCKESNVKYHQAMCYKCSPLNSRRNRSRKSSLSMLWWYGTEH